MQEETTLIFKRLWYDWTQQQPGIEPTNPLGQCWVPPIVAFYDQQGLLRTYLLPGGSIRSPHPRSPRVKQQRRQDEGHITPLGCYTDQGPRGCSQYDGQGLYCGLSTASEVFLIFTTQMILISMNLKCTIVRALTKREYCYMNTLNLQYFMLLTSSG